ncbi:MAG: hypothetical protein K5917_04530 [Clostridiales bacterium]|nr:hypothetical protein [Clostridiales bacterium]
MISAIGGGYPVMSSYQSMAAQHQQDVAEAVEFLSEMGSESSIDFASANTLLDVQLSLEDTQLQMMQDGVGMLLNMLV